MREPPTSSGPYVDQNSSWTYDAFGNRLSEIDPVANTSATFTPASNQVTATSGTAVFGYDAAGDVTYDGVNNYLYDAEGRVCAVSNFVGTITGYIYDAAGIRVARVNLNQFCCNLGYGYTPTNSYVLGLGGEQITEFNITGGASVWAHTNVFSGGALLATYSPTGNSTGSTLSGSSIRTSTYFALSDWLGTKRAEVGANGCVSTYTGMPFGGGITSNGNCTDPTEHHFTGKERDTESGLDYFGARYYASSMGRWMSPDWSAKQEPVPYSKLDDPQTLNLYGYLTNNPLSRTDADGHGPWWDLAKQTFHDAVATAKTVKFTLEAGVGFEVKGHLGNLKGELGGNVHGEFQSAKPAFSVKGEVAAKAGIGPLKIGGSASATSVVQPDGSLGPLTGKVETPKIELSGDHGPGGTLGPDQVTVGGAAYDIIGGGANVGVDAAPFHQLEGDIFQAIQNASPDWVKVKSSDPPPKPDAPK